MVQFFKYYFLFALLAVSIAFVGCTSETSTGPHETEHLQASVGNEMIHSMTEPESVRVFAVLPESKKTAKGYRKVGDGVALNASQVELLQDLLLDDQSYFFDKTKMCLFIPEIGVQFGEDTDTTLLISYHCKQVKFVSPEGEKILDIDPAYPKLYQFFTRVGVSQYRKQS